RARVIGRRRGNVRGHEAPIAPWLEAVGSLIAAGHWDWILWKLTELADLAHVAGVAGVARVAGVAALSVLSELPHLGLGNFHVLQIQDCRRHERRDSCCLFHVLNL